MAKTLKSVPSKDFTIKWNTGRDQCIFRHKSGKGGELGCGVADAVSVYSIGSNVAALSVNYSARYACLEVFSDDGMMEAVFAEPKDIKKMFPKDQFGKSSPEAIASRLSAELATTRKRK